MCSSSETWYENGKLKERLWRKDGKKHRIDDPANETWHKNGSIESQEWWVEGRRHRLDGPAHESWYPNARLRWQRWYLNGKRVWVSDRLRAAANPATSPERLARLARSVDPGVAEFAAHNPNCPRVAKLVWALTARRFGT